jgi:hypothetical protein
LIPEGAFSLRNSSGASVPGTVTYDAATATLSLTPMSQLAAGEQYTASVSGVRAVDGTALAGVVSWSFTAVACPCSLFSDASAPALQPAGSYELGIRVVVDSAATLTSLRFYKASGETGAHSGSVWSSAGVRLAQVTFADESASGWQTAALASPLQLQPGAVYVLSVNSNAKFAQTVGGFSSPLSSGVLHSADGANGVFNTTLGAMPNESYQSSNYYIDGLLTTP